MPSAGECKRLVVDGHEIAGPDPRKVLFLGPQYTRPGLARHYPAVAAGALRGAGDDPTCSRVVRTASSQVERHPGSLEVRNADCR